MRRLAAILLLAPAVAAAQDPSSYRCRLDGGELLRLDLFQPSPSGLPLHCLEGVDLSPAPACAPDGGWGLADPAGHGGDPGFATRSRDAAAATGGKLFARMGLSEFVASASEGPALPLALEVGGATFWRLRVDLRTGEGIVETREAQVPIRCERL